MFSAEPGNAAGQFIKENLGEYVVVKYSQKLVNITAKFATDYRTEQVGLIRPDLRPKDCASNSWSGLKANGGLTGRLVKLSRKGSAVKTYEAFIQVGNSGNYIVPMTVDSAAMASCMYPWMLSGRRFRLEYTRDVLKIPLVQDTNTRILKVSEPQTSL